MPKIFFIELKIASKEQLVCDVIEKLFTDNHRTVVHFDGKDEALKMDNLLWTWKQESFVPHALAEDPQTAGDEPVILTTDNRFDDTADTLVLYDPLSSEHFSGFSTIIDFAEVYHPERITESRNRYRQLRDEGRFDLEFVALGAFLNT